jgi:ketosteroid isomerase-like protein
MIRMDTLRTRPGPRFALYIVVALLIWAAPVSAQKKKMPPTDNNGLDNNATVAIPTTDNGAVDLAISQMMGAWQIGDADRMHQYYAEDVLVISGGYEPPISGWPAYLRSYQALRARTQSSHMDRFNSFIKVNGNMAWATYQWEFEGVVDGAQSRFRGHTTLVFEKRDTKWLIVLNHTSLAQPAPAAPAAKP